MPTYHRYFLPDGQKNPKYADNFKHVKYLKIVTFIGYERNYVESIPSDNPTDHSDVDKILTEIAPTYIITSINVFNISEFKKK
jgi:hypothetical protein